MKNAVMALDEKYVKLLKKSMKKFKGLSYVDSSLNPVPKSLRKSIEREIFIQLKRNRYNPEEDLDGENLSSHDVDKTPLRRKKKYIFSSASKMKLHQKNFQRVVDYFNPDEDSKILKAIEESKGQKLNIRDLSNAINRPYHSVRDRVRKFRNTKTSKRTKAKRYSLIEDKIILDEVLQYISQERLKYIPLPNPLKLSLLMKRGETSLKSRWQYYLKPMILQYYTKTLNLDVRYMLVNHIAKTYESLSSVEWEEIVKLPEFSGHTDSSIRYQFFLVYRLLLSCRRTIKKDSSLEEIAEAANVHFKETNRRYSKELLKHKAAVIAYFEHFVNTNGITNFL